MDALLSIFSSIMDMKWNCLDLRIKGAISLLASVGSAGVRLKVVGTGKCLNNTKLKGFFPVALLHY